MDRKERERLIAMYRDGYRVVVEALHGISEALYRAQTEKAGGESAGGPQGPKSDGDVVDAVCERNRPHERARASVDTPDDPVEGRGEPDGAALHGDVGQARGGHGQRLRHAPRAHPCR